MTAFFCCCGEAGAGESGLYTLTAPTGTGKTLALLNFALRQRKRRIIIVLPFLSLIEQSAREYARIIPDILEDHSQREYGDEHREFLRPLGASLHHHHVRALFRGPVPLAARRFAQACTTSPKA